MSDYKGEKLLDRIYSDLYNSNSVQRVKVNSDKREESIRRYMDRLEKIQNRLDTKHRADLIKYFYYDRYVIKEKNIPDTMDANTIISAQKNSLSKWIDYLIDENNNYPMWAKYWIFRGMIRMGSYNDLRGIYNKRSSKTTAPFIEVNPELIAKCVSNLTKKLNKDQFLEEELTELIDSESFQILYTLFEKQLKKETKIQSNSDDGIWVKYNQGNLSDALNLADSLAKVNSGWCTATKEIAIQQICGGCLYNGGDFYVYYTKKDDEYIIPRIAIRLKGHNQIGEIRGAASGQNLEKSMRKKLQEKLREMNFLEPEDVEKVLIKLDKLEELYVIGKKTVKNISLTEDEIINLYMEDYGFGCTIDPHVKRIKDLRNVKEDYQNITSKDKKIKLIRNQPLELFEVEDNAEILLEAVENGNFGVLNCASKELKGNRDFILRLVASGKEICLHQKNIDFSNVSVMNCLSDELKQDEDLVLSITKKIPKESRYIDSELVKNKEFIKRVITENPETFKNMDYSIRNDKEIVSFAIKQDPENCLYAGVDVQFDHDFFHLYSTMQEEENKKILQRIR